MSSPVIPFPGKRTEQTSEEEAVSAFAQELAAEVAAEPVPERLIALAIELGRALDEKHSALSDKAVDPTA